MSSLFNNQVDTSANKLVRKTYKLTRFVAVCDESLSDPAINALCDSMWDLVAVSRNSCLIEIPVILFRENNQPDMCTLLIPCLIYY